MPENHAPNPEPRHDGASEVPAVPAPDAPAAAPAAPVHAKSRSAAKAEGKSAGNPLLGWLKEIATVVVIAVVLSFLIKTFLFRAFFIPSESMVNTLDIDDRIFVNLLVPEPFALSRGDVVVFRDTKGWLPPAPPAATNFASIRTVRNPPLIATPSQWPPTADSWWPSKPLSTSYRAVSRLMGRR